MNSSINVDTFFDYQNSQKATCVNKIFISLFKNKNIPECIVKEIESFLFINKHNTIKTIYESKCEDYRITKQTYYNCLILNKYDFLFQFMKTVLFKYLCENNDFVLPSLRRDVYFLNTCHLYDVSFMINQQFIENNKLIILVLFIEIYFDFLHKDIYVCIYTTDKEIMNNRYCNLLAKMIV
jgi:hypothetical protein